MNKLLLASLAISVVLDAVSAQAETNQLAQAQFLEAKPIVPVFPISNKTKDKHWVQLVWNGQSGKLERQGYSIVDPLVQNSTQPFWEPERRHGVGGSNKLRQAQGDDQITGLGVLTWRPEGAVRFGRDNIIAQYQGTMLRGRFHGKGRWIHSGGSVFEGIWQNGLMHGTGQLTFPDGSVYNGEFRNGLFDGKGQLIDADGSVREGTFSGGRMDGRMQISQADGAVFAANFRKGSELPGTRTAPSPDWPVLSAKSIKRSGAKGLSITVAADEKAPFCCHNGPPSLGYRTVSSSKSLTILPTNKHLMNIWYGKANIFVGDYSFAWERALSVEEITGGADYGLLNYSSAQILPVGMRFGLKNRTSKSVRVTNAYLDMESSRLDARPALQALEVNVGGGQNLSFVIENYGWARVQDAKLTYKLKGKNKTLTTTPRTINIGNFETYKLVSFHKVLQQLGFSKINQKKASDCWEISCYTKLLSGGTFGKFKEHLISWRGSYGVDMEGNLTYRWKNAEGKLVMSSSPFSAFISFGTTGSYAECEGGTYRKVKGNKPITLAAQKKKRRIPIDIDGEVGAGRKINWRVQFFSKKSSTHRFSLVFELSDGRTVRSRPIKMNFFRPKFISPQTHNYSGVC